MPAIRVQDCGQEGKPFRTIAKPRQIAYVISNSRGGQHNTLRDQMSLSVEQFTDFEAILQKSARDHLDFSKAWKYQKPSVKRLHILEVSQGWRPAENYADVWPIEAYTAKYMQKERQRQKRQAPPVCKNQVAVAAQAAAITIQDTEEAPWVSQPSVTARARARTSGSSVSYVGKPLTTRDRELAAEAQLADREKDIPGVSTVPISQRSRSVSESSSSDFHDSETIVESQSSSSTDQSQTRGQDDSESIRAFLKSLTPSLEYLFPRLVRMGIYNMGRLRALAISNQRDRFVDCLDLDTFSSMVIRDGLRTIAKEM